MNPFISIRSGAATDIIVISHPVSNCHARSPATLDSRLQLGHTKPRLTPPVFVLSNGPCLVNTKLLRRHFFGGTTAFDPLRMIGDLRPQHPYQSQCSPYRHRTLEPAHQRNRSVWALIHNVNLIFNLEALLLSIALMEIFPIYLCHSTSTKRSISRKTKKRQSRCETHTNAHKTKPTPRRPLRARIKHKRLCLPARYKDHTAMHPPLCAFIVISVSSAIEPTEELGGRLSLYGSFVTAG